MRTVLWTSWWLGIGRLLLGSAQPAETTLPNVLTSPAVLSEEHGFVTFQPNGVDRCFSLSPPWERVRLRGKEENGQIFLSPLYFGGTDSTPCFGSGWNRTLQVAAQPSPSPGQPEVGRPLPLWGEAKGLPSGKALPGIFGGSAKEGMAWWTSVSVCPGADCALPSGQAPAGSAPHPAVCRLIHTLPGGLRAVGAGVLVDKEGQYGLIVTCQHLFREGLGKIVAVFPDGEAYEARLLHQDAAADLAALLIARPSADPVPIAARPPAPGEWVQSCGYGPDGRYWCNQGRVVGYSRTGPSAGWETLELTGRARQGDSGGPVFNSQGELAAVIWGTDGRTVSATYSGRVDRFLQQTGRYLFPWNAKNDPAHRAPSNPPGCPANPPIRPGSPGVRPAPGTEGGISQADLGRIEARLDRILELLSQQRRGLPAQTAPGGQPGVAPAGAPAPGSAGSAAAGASTGSPSQQAPAGSGSPATGEQPRAETSLLRQAVQQLVGELGNLPERIQARIEKVQAAGAHTTPETIRAYVQDFLAEKLADGSLGWTMGKLLAAALGLSGPVALALTLGAWLVARRIGRKVQAGEPLLVQQLAERISQQLGRGQPVGNPPASSP